MTRRAGVFAQVALLFSLLTPLLRAGAAQGAEDPVRMIEEGVRLRKQNQNEEAARLFLRAYQLNKSPRAVAHLGTAEFDLNRWLDAEIHLAEALRVRNDPWIEERRAAIKQTLDRARAKLGWLQVVGRPAGAEVEIAGRTIGRLPLKEPIRLEAGEVYVRVSADGYANYRRGVVVGAEQTANVVVELEPIDGPLQPPPLPPVMARPNAPPTPIEVRTSGGQNNWRWPAAWVSAGFATLFTATGVTTLLLHNSRVDEFGSLRNPKTNMLQCSTMFEEQGGAACQVLLAEAKQFKNIMIGSFVGAGVAAVLATVLFATSPSDSDEMALRPGLACLPDFSNGGSGAACHFRF